MQKVPQKRQRLLQTLGVFRAIAGIVGTLCLAGIVVLVVQLVQGGRDPAIAIFGFIFFIVIGTAATIVVVLTHKALSLVGSIQRQTRMLRQVVEQARLNSKDEGGRMKDE